MLVKTRSSLVAVSPPEISALTSVIDAETKLVDTHALTLCLRGVQDSALPRLQLSVRQSKIAPCPLTGESYQVGAVNRGEPPTEEIRPPTERDQACGCGAEIFLPIHQDVF